MLTAMPRQTFGFEYVLVIHAGADDYTRISVTSDEQAEYRAMLRAALNAGRAILDDNGTAMDAVETVLRTLEDSDLFDLGRGSVLNADGEVEMDAAIMDGSNMAAGAVAAIKTTKHPISAARAVLDKSRHVLLVGVGADRFAASVGLDSAPNSYFVSARRFAAWKHARGAAAVPVSPRSQHFGTAGVVVVDRSGHMAAGTSTGGRTNKLPGRVGDSPLIGAGTYASADCAVSGTGEGEYYIRATAARDVCARVEMLGESLEVSVAAVLKRIEGLGGHGGLIALTRGGEVVMTADTASLFRGIARDGRPPHVAIFSDEQ
jgi:beta-aspartyl-peptidase (threonine type)